MKRQYFLIVSNMRSGSTLLETMLGALPGVHADMELKWKPVLKMPAHLVISDETRDLVEVFENELDCGNSSVVGSKLVLDPVSHDPEELSHIRQIIPPEWSIIHLTRAYKDIFLSRRRGVGHIQNPSGSPIKGSVIREAVSTSIIGEESSSIQNKVDELTCYRELSLYLENDLWAFSLSETHKNYFRIDYEDIFTAFPRLVGFMGLDVQSSDVERVTSTPPLVKLPQVNPERLITNITDLNGLFDASETNRQVLIVKRKPIWNPLESWQAYQKRGKERAVQGDLDGAIDDYTHAINKATVNSSALYFLRGSLKLQMKEWKSAAEDFEAGLKLDPNNEPLKALLHQAYQERGDALAKQVDLPGAIDAYTSALNVKQPTPSLFFLRGSAMLQMKEWKGAAEDFEAGLKLDPNNEPLKALLRQAYQERGDALAKQVDLPGAIDAYTSALNAFQPTSSLYFLRGSIKLRLRECNGAAEDFEAGLKLDPDNEPLKALLRVAKEEANSPLVIPTIPRKGVEKRG